MIYLQTCVIENCCSCIICSLIHQSFLCFCLHSSRSGAFPASLIELLSSRVLSSSLIPPLPSKIFHLKTLLAKTSVDRCRSSKCKFVDPRFLFLSIWVFSDQFSDSSISFERSGLSGDSDLLSSQLVLGLRMEWTRKKIGTPNVYRYYIR